MSLQYSQITKIKVFGVGGAGCNAVSRMVNEGMQGVDFYVVNTDWQVLNASQAENKILLGKQITGGRGAGADPKIGREAALESEKEIREAVMNQDMVFVTAGMGGGTGTGAAPLLAKLAKEEGALTIAIVTKPFDFEGPKRMKVALAGIEELKEYVDAMIIVSNNRLLEVIGNIPLMDAFQEADNVLRQCVQTITDLVAVPAMVNLDFADVRSVLAGQGSALFGIGMAQGEDKALKATQQAVSSPLLEVNIAGAKKAIINVTGGKSMSLVDGQAANDYVRSLTGSETEIIWGIAINENLGESIIVTVIASGFGETPGYRQSTAAINNSSSSGGVIVENTVNDNSEEDNAIFFRNRN